jgi:hypothetical protein
MHTNRWLLAISLVCSLGLTQSARAAAVERSDDLTRTFDLASGAGASLLVDNVFGSIEVRAGDPDKVTVAIHRTVRARRDADVEAGMREVTFEFLQPSPGRLELGQDGPFRCRDWKASREDREHRGSCVDWHDPDYEVSWHWVVTVPAAIDLEVRNVNDGDVAVAGISGRVEAKNVNGAVRLAGLAGEVEAATVNGKLVADFARPPGADSSFRTVNGEIDLTLPADTGAEVGFKTLNGDLYSDFEVSAVAQHVEPTSAAGDDGRRQGHHRYHLERASAVRIGSGGPRLDCQTVNGDIVVHAH